jgi:hypothetical protein
VRDGGTISLRNSKYSQRSGRGAWLGDGVYILPMDLQHLHGFGLP